MDASEHSNGSRPAIRPLRQRMIEDMTIRRFGEHTKRDYVRHLAEFTAFLGRAPDQAEPEDLRRHQLHLASFRASYARMNLACTALRLFFHITLGRAGFGDRMARIQTPERLPVVLSTEEVALLLAHAPNLKYRAALSLAYGRRLRVSEVAHLKVSDIDSARMLIRVEQGKGRKDRYVMLAPDLLDLLRRWWRERRPQGWLFPASPSPPANSTGLAEWRPPPPGSTCASPYTRCGTGSPPTCWSARPTSASSRCCSGTASSTPVSGRSGGGKAMLVCAF